MVKKHIKLLRLFIVPAALAFSLGAKAQNWCPPGAQWVYDVGNPWMTASEQLTYSGDTIVDGYPAQRIDRIYQQTQPMNVVSEWGSIFTRTNGDVVWEWNGAAWDTLYWFSAVPGDQWQPFWSYQENCPDHAWEVQDTATTVIDGIPLRTLFLHLTEQGVPTGQVQTIYERIGGGAGFGFPGLPPCGAIYECYCTFTCYQDQDIIPQGGPCALPLSVPYLDPARGLVVFPNPASDRVALTLPEGPIFQIIEIIGTDGRLVRSVVPNNTTTAFSVEDLPDGVYLIRAFTEHDRLHAPFVVSR